MSNNVLEQNFVDNFILINKPPNCTSFDVVNKIRYGIKRAFNIKKIKVGHAGTLDPLATGLLIVCTGKFTKKINDYQALEKEYTGNFTLGATTPSYDMETPIDQTYKIDHITPALIKKTTKKFLGTINQIPPIFSALKINGERAYKKARKKEEVILKPKKVEISEFEITKIDFPVITFRVVCSKGTYIRSLTYDFGKALKTGAYLSSLCRTRIGKYKLEDALTIDELGL